jgi:diacylglycerol kinase family enzyme
MRALLVVNPAATTTSARTREVLASALEAELKLEVVHTQHRGHATELAAAARCDELDLVVVLGGDGTVNEVVNGLLADGPHDGVPALAVVPGGGTNVFHRALGLPRDPVEATAVLLDALRERRLRSIGLGRVELGHLSHEDAPDDGAGPAGDQQDPADPARQDSGRRWFTFNAGMGWDAEVVARVDERRRARSTARHTRPADYVRAAAEQFFLHSDRRHPALSVQRPGAEPVTGLHLAIVANTEPWTFLGDRPLRTSPEASFDAGLDLYALTRLRTLGTLGEVRRLLSGSPTPARRGPRTLVHREHDLAALTLVADRSVATQADGESLGARRRLDFAAVPDAIRVVV